MPFIQGETPCIPLKGKLVSGLHVWNNLAVIPASINLSKGNKCLLI